MLTKNELKYYSSLLQKKFRVGEMKFLVEGPKLIAEAIEFGFYCEIIILTHTYEEEIIKINPDLLRRAGRIEYVKNLGFQKLTDTKTPQEIIGVFLEKSGISLPQNHNKIVALENVSDPGNLGSIIRNCDWFGIKHIMLSKDCAEVFNPKVIRSSAGSVFHISFNRADHFFSELERKKNNGYKILCADLDGENIYLRKWEEKIVIVLANEANGPTEDLLKLTDAIITIPKIGDAESLNVSNACAVILSEATRSISNQEIPS